MNCLIGLGNPGKRYVNTRHNVGFFICDALAKKNNVKFEKGPGQYDWASVKIRDKELLLIKPTTYMNRSGIAFADIQRRFVLLNSDPMIVFDDFHLPLGKIRIRSSGSDGGHNGLASIVNYARTNTIPRMRIGIGKPDNTDIINFVLSDFDKSEMVIVHKTIERAFAAIECWLECGIDKAMSHFNQ